MTHKKLRSVLVLLSLIIAVVWSSSSPAQSPVRGGNDSSRARPMTIPITIKVGDVEPDPEMELRMVDLTITEDGEPQTILSIRAMGTNSPITLGVLLQDDVVSSVANEIKSIGNFIRALPRGSRVMVGNIRAGSLQVRQRFTTDLERAARSLRPPLGIASAAPYNPYVEVIEALRRFDSQPSGRRALLIVSDGLDTSRGLDSSSPTASLDLQRAIAEAQRRSVAIYAFYAPTTNTAASSSLAANAQSSLQKLSDETGGQAFFQGTGAPVSFTPFLRNLSSALDRQVAITYLSTHPGKGFHRLQVRSSTPGVEIAHPAGYSRRQ